jgi:hypothetical protein
MCELSSKTSVKHLTLASLMLTGGARSLRILLSFAVGCLLGDVFLHLLPEVWMETPVGKSHLLWRKLCSSVLYVDSDPSDFCSSRKFDLCHSDSHKISLSLPSNWLYTAVGIGVKLTFVTL